MGGGGGGRGVGGTPPKFESPKPFLCVWNRLEEFSCIRSVLSQVTAPLVLYENCKEKMMGSWKWAGERSPARRETGYGRSPAVEVVPFKPWRGGICLSCASVGLFLRKLMDPDALAVMLGRRCKEPISEAWEKPCWRLTEPRRPRLFPAFPKDLQGNFSSPISTSRALELEVLCSAGGRISIPRLSPALELRLGFTPRLLHPFFFLSCVFGFCGSAAMERRYVNPV